MEWGNCWEGGLLEVSMKYLPLDEVAIIIIIIQANMPLK
jgi:hypothetical protein